MKDAGLGLMVAMLIFASGFIAGVFVDRTMVSDGEYAQAVCEYMKGALHGDVCVKDGKVIFDASERR